MGQYKFIYSTPTSFNVIKYTIRMMAINDYIKCLEQKINQLVENKMFIWNTELINCGIFWGGFAVINTLGQIPIQIAVAIYLFFKFTDTLQTDQILKKFHSWFSTLLIIELICIFGMLIDTLLIQILVIRKVKKCGFGKRVIRDNTSL